MATYNGAKYIKEQVDSILVQLGPNDELVISDDGSTDGTLDILTGLGDPRIKIHHHTKKITKYSFGYTSSNFGNALQYASGEYIFLSDQDDVWIEGRLEKMLYELRQADAIISDCRIVDENMNTLLPSKFAAEGVSTGILTNIFKCSYLGCTMGFRRKVCDYALPFPDNVPHDLWIGITVRTKGRIRILRQPTVMYRRHMNNVSATSNTIRLTKGQLPKNSNTVRFKLSYRLCVLKEYIKFLFKSRL